MQTIRRLYVYLISGVSLGVLLVGLNLLLSVGLRAVGLDAGPFSGGSPSSDREQLSLAAALTVVGLLVWGVHWWFAERSVRDGQDGSDAERASPLRAFYISAVLATLLGFGAVAGALLLRAALMEAMGARATDADLAGTASTILVCAAAWAFHAQVRRRDLAIEARGPAAWWPRVYVYGASLVGAVMVAAAVGRLLGIGLVAAVGEDGIGSESDLAFVTASELGSLLVWGAVWIGHWWYATRIASDEGWRGASERPSRLRLTYFVAVIGAAVIGTTWFAADAVRALVMTLLEVRDVFGADPDLAPVLAVGLPLVAAMPWAVGWLMHRRWMRTEAWETDADDRPATVRRLEAAAAALVGIAFAAVGGAWLAGLGIDAAFGGNRITADGYWQVELAQYLGAAIVGLGPWAWGWARLQARRRTAPVVEASSTTRRAYLLVVLASSILAGIGSLAFVLYRLFGTLLDVTFFDNAASALSTPLGILAVTVAVAAYHAVNLRRDRGLQPARDPVMPATEGPGPARSPGRPLLLTGPAGGDLDAALAVLREQLPPGFGLEVTEEAAGSG